MRKPPIKEGITFWLLSGVGVVLAIWQYARMVSSYAD